METQSRGSAQGEQRCELARGARALYERGQSIRQLAAAYGYSYGGMRSLLLAAGTPLRARGSTGHTEGCIAQGGREDPGKG